MLMLLKLDPKRPSCWLANLNRSELALFLSVCLSVLETKLDTADIVIALGKAWKRRNQDETVKLLDAIQRVKVPG
jgi:hypothetical protein